MIIDYVFEYVYRRSRIQINTFWKNSIIGIKHTPREIICIMCCFGKTLKNHRQNHFSKISNTFLKRYD